MVLDGLPRPLCCSLGVLHPFPGTCGLVCACSSQCRGRGEKHKQANLSSFSRLYLHWLTSYWPKQVTWLSPVSRGRAEYPFRELQIYMAKHRYREKWRTGCINAIHLPFPSLLKKKKKSSLTEV